ncbi:MAG: ferritin-like domain-containing protein [Limnothrix sp. RL_2_0]|nr:ferritin-like domain-containing protein [Limnothrix sp. RL_2_0]
MNVNDNLNDNLNDNFNDLISNITGFSLPYVEINSPLQKILASALLKTRLPSTDLSPANLFWDANYFALNHVQLFTEASDLEQSQILQIANNDLLEEIYWVEQAGVGYMAKMLLLAETCEERLLYSLFAADEATHLSQISPFLGYQPVFTGDSFLAFMAEVVETDDKALLMTLVQVVLEGWGLSHYRSLANHCLNPVLTLTLKGFLEAESRHHATGVTQLKQWTYSPQSLANIHDALSTFLQMVQVGPQRLLMAIAKIKGDLSYADKIQILEELQTEIHSQKRLDILRSLMTGIIPNSIMQKLEDQGSFKPYSAVQCAQ